MKAKRTLLVFLLSLVLLLCYSAMLVACDDETIAGTHAVSFKADGKTYDVALVDDGKTVTLPAAPTKDGYTFVGWYTDEEYTQTFDESTVITASTALYAKMTANTYTVTYNLDGGTNPNTVTSFTVNDKVMLSDAVKPGYLFKGWKNGEEYMTSIPKGTTENITLTAVFEKNGYVINYEGIGGAYCQNPKAYSVDDETFILNPATKDGCDFDGWYLNAEYTGDKVTKIVKGTTGNITLYAKFTEAGYSAPTIESIGFDYDEKLAWFRENGSVVPNTVGLYIDVLYSDSTVTHVAVTEDMLSYDASSSDEFTVTVTYCGKTATFDVKVFDSTEGFSAYIYYGCNYYDNDNYTHSDVLLANAENGGFLRDYWVYLSQKSGEDEYWYGVKLTEAMLRLYTAPSSEEGSGTYEAFNLSSLDASTSADKYYQVKVDYNGITIDALHLYKVKAEQLWTNAYYLSTNNYKYVSAGSRDFVMSQIREGEMKFDKYVVFDVWGNECLQVFDGSWSSYKHVTFGDLSDIDFGDYSKELRLPACMDGEEFYLSVTLVPPYYYDLAFQYMYTLYYDENHSTKVLLLPDGKIFPEGNYVYDYYWLDGFDDVIVYQGYLYRVDRENRDIYYYLISENTDAEKICTYSFYEPEDKTYNFELYKLNGKYYIYYNYENNECSWIAEFYDANTMKWFDTVYVIGDRDSENECYPITVYVDKNAKALYTYDYDDRGESGGKWERWVYKNNGIRYYYVYDTKSEAFICSSYDFWKYTSSNKNEVYVYDMFSSNYFFVAFLTEVTETAETAE